MLDLNLKAKYMRTSPFINGIHSIRINQQVVKEHNLEPRENLAYELHLKIFNKTIQLNEKQLKLHKRIKEVAKDSFGKKLNYFRVFLNNLILLPTEIKNQRRKIVQDLETNFVLKNQEICDRWNKLIALIYGVSESSNYSVEENQYVLDYLNELNSLFNSIAEELFGKDPLKEQLSEDLKLLRESINDPDLFLLFLFPIENYSKDFYLNENKIKSFKKSLALAKVASTFSQKILSSKKSKIKDPLEILVNAWNKEISNVENLSKKCQSLQDLVLNGDGTQLEELKNSSKNLINKIAEIHKRLFNEINNKCEIENLLNPNLSREISVIYLSNFQAPFWLIFAMHDAFFATLSNHADRAIQILQTVRPYTNSSSIHFNFLDYYRMWWTEALYTTPSNKQELNEEYLNRTRNQIKSIFFILSQTRNALFKNADVREIIKEMINNDVEKQYSDQLNVLKLIFESKHPNIFIKFLLNISSNTKSNNDERKVFSKLLSQFNAFISCLDPEFLNHETLRKVHSKFYHMIDSFIMASHSSLNGLVSNEEIKKLAQLAYQFYDHNSIESLTEIPSELNAISDETITTLVELYESLKHHYLRPFLSLGNQLFLDKHRKRNAPKLTLQSTKTQPKKNSKRNKKKKTGSISKPVLTQNDSTLSNIRNHFEPHLVTMHPKLQYQFLDLLDLLEKPLSLEAIYRSLARVVESKINPSESHQIHVAAPHNEAKWLERLEKYLPLKSTTNNYHNFKIASHFKKALKLLEINDSIPIEEISEIQINPTRTNSIIENFKEKFEECLPVLTKNEMETIAFEIPYKRILRQNQIQEILNSIPSTCTEIQKILSIACLEPLSRAHLAFLILKTGQLIEAGLKYNMLQFAIASQTNLSQHLGFDIKNNRPFRYDHNLHSLAASIQDRKKLEIHELELLKKWQYYSESARYDHSSTHCSLAKFLLQAQLLNKTFHTEEEIKEISRLEISGKDKNDLFRMQNDSFVPEVYSLINLTSKLFNMD